MRTLVSISELTPDELDRLVRRTVEIAADGPTGDRLSGRLVAICADHPAQPDCLAMWSAATRLGAHVVVCGPTGLPLGEGPAGMSGRILGQYLDAIVVAVDAGIEEIFGLGADGDLAVIAAHTNEEQPIQALAALTALFEHFGWLAGRHLLCVGTGAAGASLALAWALLPGVTVTVLGPPAGQPAAGQLTSAFGTIRRACSPEEVDGPVHIIHAAAGIDLASVAPTLTPETVLLHDRSHGPAPCWSAGAPADPDGIRCLCDLRARYAMAAALAVLEWCVIGLEKTSTIHRGPVGSAGAQPRRFDPI
jgi:ornithine carbamoyltransferase